MQQLIEHKKLAAKPVHHEILCQPEKVIISMKHISKQTWVFLREFRRQFIEIIFSFCQQQEELLVSNTQQTLINSFVLFLHFLPL